MPESRGTMLHHLVNTADQVYQDVSTAVSQWYAAWQLQSARESQDRRRTAVVSGTVIVTMVLVYAWVYATTIIDTTAVDDATTLPSNGSPQETFP
jgi:hypothetical protein